MHRNFLKAAMLAIWLWLPSLAVLSTDHLQSTSDVLALLCFSIFILAAPLVALPGPRFYFLVMAPLALLVGPYCYLTWFYHSVPGDALLLSAWQSSWVQTRQVLASFGWIVALVPLSGLLYLALACSLDRGWKLGTEARKRLLAGLLLFAMLAMTGHTWLSQTLKLPPFMKYSTASLAFPSGLALSSARMLRQQMRETDYLSVQGRYSAGAQPLLVVFIIGESLRPDHLGLNGYQRNTTPGLSALGPQVLRWPNAVSTANATSLAVPDMTSLAVGGQQASLVQTFREAGFRTAWISNQEPNQGSSMAHVVEHATGSQDYHMRTDDMLLPIFASFTRQAGPRQFVVLHMNGSHIPYEERYDASSRIFRPTLKDIGVLAPQVHDREATVNSYDNTIIATDKFLVRVIEMLRRQDKPAVLLFASDHGENLFDDARGMFMHAQMPPTAYDLRVAVMAWMNDAYKQHYPQQAHALEANQTRAISHWNMFPTVLDLGAVDWQGRRPQSSFASPEFTTGPRMVRLNLTDKAEFETLH